MKKAICAETSWDTLAVNRSKDLSPLCGIPGNVTLQDKGPGGELESAENPR